MTEKESDAWEAMLLVLRAAQEDRRFYAANSALCDEADAALEAWEAYEAP